MLDKIKIIGLVASIAGIVSFVFWIPDAYRDWNANRVENKTKTFLLAQRINPETILLNQSLLYLGLFAYANLPEGSRDASIPVPDPFPIPEELGALPSISVLDTILTQENLSQDERIDKWRTRNFYKHAQVYEKALYTEKAVYDYLRSFQDCIRGGDCSKSMVMNEMCRDAILMIKILHQIDTYFKPYGPGLIHPNISSIEYFNENCP